MTMLPRAVAIFAATEPIDMRRSFDRLAAARRETLGQDPRSGALFLFVNRAADRLKVLWWDRTGYCILYKRSSVERSGCRARCEPAKPG
jgi:transposase